MSFINNAKKTFVVGVSALSVLTGLSATTAHAADTNTIPAKFEIESGVLTLKFIKQSEFNTKSAQPTYKFEDFAAAGEINMYTDGSIDTDGNTKPKASSSDVDVKGNVVIGFLNGSGRGFTSNTTLTNFSDGAKVLPLCNQAGTPCTGARMGTEAKPAVASTSTGYTGQGVATTNAPSSELTTEQNIQNLSNMASDGVSNSFSLLNFNDGSGNGEFYKKTQLNYKIPAFAQTGNYTATYTVTAVVNP